MTTRKHSEEQPEQWTYRGRDKANPTEGEKDAHGFTPEMRTIAEALTHPDGDPYDNARQMGFYCEQCG